MTSADKEPNPISKASQNSCGAWLSILIPVFNAAPFLQKCVLSILEQADRNVEIILLDDCSTDDSRKICARLAEEFPGQIKIMSHPANRGISAARNSMLDVASGEYIWFLDADDYLKTGAIAELRTIIGNQNPDLILCDYDKRRCLFKKSFPGWGRRKEYDISKLISGVFQYRKMYIWLKIARRSLWADDLRFPEGRTFEDITTTPRLLLRAKSYYYTPHSWVYYRIHQGSFMASVTRTRNYFDADKNEQMAQALAGFKEILAEQNGPLSRNMAFYMARFVAKEFVKLANRYNSDKSPRQVPLRHYFERMQSASPISFGQLKKQYLMRAQFINYYYLKKAFKQLENSELS